MITPHITHLARHVAGPGACIGFIGIFVAWRLRAAVQRERCASSRWPPRDEPFPVGYYCGLRDPNGNHVKFSYGQPLGPGAEVFDLIGALSAPALS